MSDQYPYTFGKYQIEAEIGRGGFGNVYRAIDTTLQRPVALKILNGMYMRDQKWVSQFRKEAAVMAKLMHKNIVSVYECNKRDGALYIAMELVNGGNLKQLIQEGQQVAWGEVVRLMRQIASAVDYAHARNILHRDIKPANILLEDGNVKLSDFGLANLMESNGLSVSFGEIVGTYEYMAPEILRDQPATPAIDIYALGCILYELVTGTVLFGRGSVGAIITAHLMPIELPERFATGVPEGLRAVLKTVLAKEPADRYKSGAELIAALDRLTPSHITELNVDLKQPLIEQTLMRGARKKGLSRKENEGEVTRRIIVTIGIDKYEYFPKLYNAANDARGVHKLFTESLGFEAPFPPLINEQATKQAITDLIEDKLPEKVDEDDAIVLYFAGHGMSRLVKKKELGYLVPVNARKGHWGGALRIDNFFNSLDNMNARHIVVLLDACHSGFASALNKHITHVRGDVPPYAADLQRKKSRHVITSAMDDQDAFDDGPIDGHSLFTGYLIRGLQLGLADRDGNGVIMTAELGAYVHSEVAMYSNGKQTPDIGRFAPWADERGQLVFNQVAIQEPKSESNLLEQQMAVSDLQHIFSLKQMLDDPQLSVFAIDELKRFSESKDRMIARAARAALQ